MNKVLLSSKKMDYCTPQDFFDALDEELHFALDAAATAKSAKCKRYYTPEDDGLSQSWDCGGQFTATRRMDERLADGGKRHTRKHKKVQRWCYSFRREQTPHISMITYMARRKFDLSVAACVLRTRTGSVTMRHRFRQWLLCIGGE